MEAVVDNVIKSKNERKTQSKQQNEKTRTSSFGSSKRIGHDSSDFYKRKIYNDKSLSSKSLETSSNQVESKFLNQVHCHSSEDMHELPDQSVHLVVTSPPYNVGKEYDEDLSIDEYRMLLFSVFAECGRVLVDGGRACINIANVGRKPYIPLNGLISTIMLDLGYFMRGEIIWDKGASAGVSCAWGSWKSPSNPVLRDIHEYILIFSKGTYKRLDKGEPSISKQDFLDWTKSIWRFPADSARRVGHPAPFPVELPRRLIDLYTYQGDIVLDPFIGSGSTAVASHNLQRNWIGYDISSEYCKLTQNRIMGSRKLDD